MADYIFVSHVENNKSVWVCPKITFNLVASQECVGDDTKGPEPNPARLAVKVRFAVDVEAHVGPTAEPTKWDRRAPIKIVGGFT